jgi:hypothetical protein
VGVIEGVAFGCRCWHGMGYGARGCGMRCWRRCGSSVRTSGR